VILRRVERDSLTYFVGHSVKKRSAEGFDSAGADRRSFSMQYWILQGSVDKGLLAGDEEGSSSVGVELGGDEDGCSCVRSPVSEVVGWDGGVLHILIPFVELDLILEFLG